MDKDENVEIQSPHVPWNKSPLEKIPTAEHFLTTDNIKNLQINNQYRIFMYK